MHDLVERDNELSRKSVLVFGESEEVRVQDGFFVAVHDHQPERLFLSMEFFLPFEIASCSEIHLQTASGQWLSVCFDLNTRNVMNKFVENLPQFGETSEISDFLRIHLVE